MLYARKNFIYGREFLGDGDRKPVRAHRRLKPAVVAEARAVLTSNKSFEEWGEIYGDDVMAAALIDRLLHHWNVVNIRGNSYRMRHPRRTLDYPQLTSRRGR
jgi:hypothetical protein